MNSSGPSALSFPKHSFVFRWILYAFFVLLMGNLGAIVDLFLHPEIPYFDNEHIIEGGITAFTLILLFAMQERYITRRNMNEDLRLRSEENYRTLFDNASDGIFIMAADGRIIDVNEAFARMHGYGTGELLRMNIRDLDTEKTSRLVPERMRRLLAGESLTFEVEHHHKDGRVFPLEVSAQLVSIGGKPCIQGFHRDIASRKMAEEVLRKREEQLATILRTTMDGFWVTDRKGRFLEVNDAVCRNLGYSRDELLRMSVADIEAVEKQEMILQVVRRIMERGSDRFEGLHRCKDGSLRNVEISVNYLPPPHDCFFAFLHDITARKRTESELRLSRQLLALHVQRTPLAVIRFDLEGRVREWNPSAATVFGYTQEEAIGQHWRFLVPESMGRQVDAVWQGLVGRGCGSRSTGKNLTKDGRVISCEWFNTTLIDPEGKTVGVASLVMDVTEREKAEKEKEKLQAQLQQAMKMEAVGRLAGGVAHDFNNLLTVINGYGDLLMRKLGKESPQHREVEEIQRAGERAATLTQQLLAFSRKQIIEPKVVRLDRQVAETQGMLARLIGESIDLRTTSDESRGSVRIDPGQFQQILVNLVVNARDAMPNGGKIVVETANVDLDGDYCARHPYVKPGRFVMLAVSDTGMGMDETVKAHLFEPFFTTKERGSGTGLGLATTYGAVKQAGGSIEVFSEVGVGTTFRIYLPRVDEEAGKPAGEAVARDLPRGMETMLVVEDEDRVRALCVLILEQLGYKVLQARNGNEAIGLAQGYGGRIDLLLTDVVMPGMNGSELARQMVRNYPEMKVLFTSGYTDDAIVRHGVLDESVSFIGKPYTPSALARKIREVLEGA